MRIEHLGLACFLTGMLVGMVAMRVDVTERVCEHNTKLLHGVAACLRRKKEDQHASSASAELS